MSESSPEYVKRTWSPSCFVNLTHMHTENCSSLAKPVLNFTTASWSMANLSAAHDAWKVRVVQNFISHFWLHNSHEQGTHLIALHFAFLRVRATSINFICKHLFVCKSGERVNLKLLRETPTEFTYIRIFILVEWVKQRIHWITVHYGVAGTTPRYRVAFCVVKSLEHRKCGGMWDWLPPINLTEAHENKAQKKQLHCSFIYSFYFSLKLTLKTWRKQRRWQTNFF